MKKICILDYGLGNIKSLYNSLKKIGLKPEFFSEKKSTNYDIVFIPGVGSFKKGSKLILQKKYLNFFEELKANNTIIFGICLGMQLMASTSVEGATQDKVECLNIIPTDIKPLKANGLRLPQMGWNTLTSLSEHPVFAGIKPGDYFYFVHSFAAPVSKYTIATCDYGSQFSAAIAKDNFIGCQFHPERSSSLGSQIIKNFLEMPL